ncbi:MAG TPA: hypothetical protein PLB05_07540 [Candidatus Omnitrophota bacterium]|jgi:uncharacterized membrane protein|nr:hypothetical protein [Candidatus Omnitrophota bacterium]HPN56454.1 hypothetical protein [Candidatus Omnitrophota bacterium]
MPKKTESGNDQIAEGKVFALLAYLSIFCIIPLLFKRENEFVLSHAKQGLVIFIGEVGVFILSIIFPAFLRLGFFCFGLLSFAGIVAALRGRIFELPLIASIADKITL